MDTWLLPYLDYCNQVKNMSMNNRLYINIFELVFLPRPAPATAPPLGLRAQVEGAKGAGRSRRVQRPRGWTAWVRASASRDHCSPVSREQTARGLAGYRGAGTSPSNAPPRVHGSTGCCAGSPFSGHKGSVRPNSKQVRQRSKVQV